MTFIIWLLGIPVVTILMALVFVYFFDADTIGGTIGSVSIAFVLSLWWPVVLPLGILFGVLYLITLPFAKLVLIWKRKKE